MAPQVSHTQPFHSLLISSVTAPERPVTIPKSPVTIPERAVTMGRNTHPGTEFGRDDPGAQPPIEFAQTVAR